MCPIRSNHMSPAHHDSPLLKSVSVWCGLAAQNRCLKSASVGGFVLATTSNSINTRETRSGPRWARMWFILFPPQTLKPSDRHPNTPTHKTPSPLPAVQHLINVSVSLSVWAVPKPSTRVSPGNEASCCPDASSHCFNGVFTCFPSTC